MTRKTCWMVSGSVSGKVLSFPLVEFLLRIWCFHLNFVGTQSEDTDYSLSNNGLMLNPRKWRVVVSQQKPCFRNGLIFRI